MTTFKEGRLELTFGPEWDLVVKWDETGAHRATERAIHGTKAVDFCGVRRGNGSRELLFIELKDFRRHRIENKKRLSGELADEVAQKVRDTVAGLVGAAHCRPTEPEWLMFVQALARTKGTLKVILWLEQDEFAKPPRNTQLGDELRRRLAWLTSRVVVMDRREAPRLGVTVAELPDGGAH